MTSKFIENFLTNWKIVVPTFFAVWIILTLIQIYILQKGAIFAGFHSFLISALVTI